MRVVLLVPAFPRLSETFTVHRFTSLLAMGVDVHIVCRRKVASDWKYFPELDRPGVESRVHIRSSDPPGPSALLWALSRLIALFIRRPRIVLRYLAWGSSRLRVDVIRAFTAYEALIRLKPNVIHFEYGHLALAEAGLGRVLGARTIASFQGADINYIGLEDPDFYAKVWADVDVIHVVSEDLWHRARSRGCPGEKDHVVIPPVMDLDSFRSESTRAVDRRRPLRLLSVGRLHWKKGYEYAVEAIRLLRERWIDCEFRIVGDGQFGPAIELALRQHGVERCTALLGALSSLEIREQMEWADMLVHAAVSEGFCCVAVEAQAMGLPVVATDADGLNESISDHSSGFVVPRRDGAALAEKIAVLASDPRIYQRMSEAAKAHAQNFSRERTTQRFLELYRQVAHERRAS